MLHRLNRWMDRRKMMVIFWSEVATYPLMGITATFAGSSLLWPFLVAVASLLLLVMLGGFCMLRMKLGIPA